MDKLIELFQTDWGGVTFLILYTSLLFTGWAWMLSAKINPIKELLTNHITDTNKKIDDLQSSTNQKIDDLQSSTNQKIDDLKSDIKEVRQDIKELLKRK